MADQVQAALDQMVAPLKDLLDRGIFTEDEIRSIVSRRREYEYLLRRRASRKADFLRYIETEMALEKLRALRARQAVLKEKAAISKKEKMKERDDRASNKQKQKKIGDFHIVQHIHLLFVRAIRKFKGDVTLHLQHAAFCKQVRSFSRLTRIYAEALQIHPKNVGLWIEAASHEYFGVVVEEESFGRQTKEKVVHGGGSVQNARVILQRGLRINPSSQDLWLQTFGLELHYIMKLRGRQNILFPVQHDSGADENANSESQASTARISDTLPLLVFKNAIRSIPGDLTFRLKFLDLCQHFPKESVDGVQRHIMDTIRSDFVSEPSAWISWAAQIAKARNESNNKDAKGFLSPMEYTPNMDDDNQVEPPPKRTRTNDTDSEIGESMASPVGGDPVLNVLKEALGKVTSSEMVLHSVQFARSYAESIGKAGAFTNTASPAPSLERSTDMTAEVKAVYDFINELFERAAEFGAQTPELVLEQVSFLLSGESSDHPDATAAITVLESYCSKRVESLAAVDKSKAIPSALWIRWAELRLMVENQNVNDLATQHSMSASVLDVLRMGLKHTPMTTSIEHMILLMHLIAGLIMIISKSGTLEGDCAIRCYDEELCRLFQEFLILAPGQINLKIVEEGIHCSNLFGACSVSQLCLKYLRLSKDLKGVQGARSVIHRVLFQHQLPSLAWVAHDAEGWKAYINECIAVESLAAFAEQGQKATSYTSSLERKAKRQRLDRLFSLASNLFRETYFGDYYKQKRCEVLARLR